MFTPVIDCLILFALISPLIGTIAKGKEVDKVLGVFSSIGFLASLYLLYGLYRDLRLAKNGILVYWSPLTPLSGSCLKVDMLSIYVSAIFILVGLMASIFSIRYMEHDTGHSLYYSLLLAMVAGMVGVTFSGDFFTLFLFWELMCLTSYVLVAFRKEFWEPVEAGFKYLIMSSAGSALILFSIALLYGMTGSVNLSSIARVFAQSGADSSIKVWTYLIFGLLLTGFGIKASIVPLHTWLPDAHPAAPTPISAMLSGVVIKTGVFAMIRIFFTILHPAPLDWGIIVTISAIFAALTMTVGNVMALLQNDIKRLLAFSSIAQIGYILLAISVGFVGGIYGLYGLTSGLLHVLNHAIMKALLFLTAGAIIHAAGTRSLTELTGIGHRMHATAVILTVGALAISGVPPFNGFISELAILLATINAGLMIFAVIMLANILIGFSYYLRLLYILVWQAPKEGLENVKEAPPSMLLPMGILAFLCILIGVWPHPFIYLASKAAEAAMNTVAYISAI